MKIAIVTTWPPFLRGGAEYLAEALNEQLSLFGHKSVLIKIPFRYNPEEKILEHMFACMSVKLVEMDRIIALKFPAYLVPHPVKVVWLLHQFRQAYELWDTPWQFISNTPQGFQIKESIHKTDTSVLSDAYRIYTNSKITHDRLLKYNGIESEILIPPLLTTTNFFCKQYGDYMFCPSRIGAKRQHLMIESLKYTKTNVKLIIAGNVERQDYFERMLDMINNYNLQDRVTIISRYITEDEKCSYYANALGVIYLPIDEDSPGYVTLEAFYSKKPVITCEDSGGTLLWVKDNETGYVTKAIPEQIGLAIDNLYNNRKKAKKFGENGNFLVNKLNINWESTIGKLLK